MISIFHSNDYSTAINVGLRHVEASHDYPWPPYIPGLFVEASHDIV